MMHFLNDIGQKTEQFVQSQNQVTAKDLGLDERAGNRFYTDGFDGIIVDREADRILQYFGGFEYVDKYYREEIGNYVFYLTGDDRVDECLENYRNLESV
jgi:hypothetical protein